MVISKRIQRWEIGNGFCRFYDNFIFFVSHYINIGFHDKKEKLKMA